MSAHAAGDESEDAAVVYIQVIELFTHAHPAPPSGIGTRTGREGVGQNGIQGGPQKEER